MTLDKDFPSAQLGRLTLRIDTHNFALHDAARSNDEGVDNDYRWAGIPSDILALTEDASITVQLLVDPAAATGQPTISGVPQVGRTLTANVSKIMDTDGLPVRLTYQWVRVDASDLETNVGTNRSTYSPVAADVGHTIRVKVSFTDDAGNMEGPLESEATAAVEPMTVIIDPVTVTIAANQDVIGGGLEDLVFTLTREGATAAELEVMVTIDQAQTWLTPSDLSHTVTFPTGSPTATLALTANRFSFDPATSGDLTATVSGTRTEFRSKRVEIVSTSEPPITISYDKPEYTFAETDHADDVVIYAVATLHPAYPRAPSRSFLLSFSTRADTATSPTDYALISWQPEFVQAEFAREGDRLVARKPVPDFVIVNDLFYEGSEHFTMIIEMAPGLPAGLTQFVYPDGTTCEQQCGDRVRYSVFITDEEDLPTLSLSAAPASIAEEDDSGTTGVAENVSTLTVSIANGETLPADRTVTLVFDGTAAQGTHYSVRPVDADAEEEDHQVVLSAGDSSVEVTVTAVANDTADNNRSVVVDGYLGVKEIGRTFITILDDETTTANTPATGKPTIAGTPQLWQVLTVGTSGIMDDDGLPASFTYRWVRVDALDIETVVGANRTYMPTSFDVGSTIRVEVRFIDAAGNPEGPLASEATATVTLVCEADAVWCTTLTAGVDDHGPRGYCGPGTGTMHCDYGSLVDDDFTLDGTTAYTVESVRWGDDNLHLTLDKDFPSASLGSLTFRIGTQSRILSNATRGNVSGNVDNNYRWSTPGEIRDLPAGFAITVQLLPRATTNLGATGMLTIEGVPQAGRTLTANVSDIRDDDGLPATLTYQWVRVATGGAETNVGTDSSSYTVSSADVDSTIRVDVSFTDLAGNPRVRLRATRWDRRSRRSAPVPRTATGPRR